MFKHVKNYEKEETILFYIGNCYFELSNYNEGLFNISLFNKDLSNESLLYYNQAIEINPDNLNAWNNKAVSLINLGRYDEAIRICDKAIEVEFNNLLAWYNRARIHSIIDDKERAMSDLGHAIELDSSYKEIARNDSDFEELWTDKEFKKLVSSNN